MYIVQSCIVTFDIMSRAQHCTVKMKVGPTNVTRSGCCGK